MILSNNVYDILNKLQRWLPAVGIFYLTVATIWGLPFGDQVNQTIVAVCTLLAAYLEVSTSQYNKLLR
jgi:hypothetical protein